MKASALDRRIQVRRATYADDGFTAAAETWADYGEPIWASRKDVSDGERWRAGEVGASVTTRFQVRWSPFTAGISVKDRLVCEDREYEVVGTKELGRREGVEITAARRAE